MITLTKKEIMKKIMLPLVLALSLTYSHAGSTSLSEASAVSILSAASVGVLSPMILTGIIDTLSKSPPTESRNLKVDNVTHQANNKSLINATATVDGKREPIQFEVPTQVAKETHVASGQNLQV